MVDWIQVPSSTPIRSIVGRHLVSCWMRREPESTQAFTKIYSVSLVIPSRPILASEGSGCDCANAARSVRGNESHALSRILFPQQTHPLSDARPEARLGGTPGRS